MVVTLQRPPGGLVACSFDPFKLPESPNIKGDVRVWGDIHTYLYVVLDCRDADLHGQK